tara:strand:- start:293 stop:529 length:237 start_codon:yes stop_codon:yes gene_type:complete
VNNDDFYISGPNDYDEQTDAFRFDLDDLVDRYLEEFDINTLTMIGALTEKANELMNMGNIEFEIDDDFFNDYEEEDEI